MTIRTSLATAVAARLAEINSTGVDSAELVRAAMLSDMFSDVQPEAYVLPLDAMGGFVVAEQWDEPEVSQLPQQRA